MHNYHCASPLQGVTSRPSIPRSKTALKPKVGFIGKVLHRKVDPAEAAELLERVELTYLASSSWGLRNVSSSVAAVMIGPARSFNSGASLVNSSLSTREKSENVPFTDSLVRLRICRDHQLVAEIQRFLHSQVIDRRSASPEDSSDVSDLTRSASSVGYTLNDWSHWTRHNLR